MNTKAQIQSVIEEKPEGTPLFINDFYSLGSVSSVQRVFAKLTAEKSLYRFAKGIYIKPKLIPELNLYFRGSPETIAYAWAKRNNYLIAPQGHEDANQLGFQTQVPMQTILWSTGPSRKFSIGNNRVTVRRVSSNKLLWFDSPEGKFIRAFSVLPLESISNAKLQVAFQRLLLSSAETEKVIANLLTANINNNFKKKLEEFRINLKK